MARVRGDGREYQLNLYTAERMRAFSYRAPVKTRAGEWIEVAVPLDRFEATSFGRVIRGAGPVDPRSVTSIGFLLAEKTPGPFALEVAWIKVLRNPCIGWPTCSGGPGLHRRTLSHCLDNTREKPVTIASTLVVTRVRGKHVQLDQVRRGGKLPPRWR